MARDSDKAARPAGPTATLLADRREGADLWGVGEAMRPLADLMLSPDAETPFALGLVGGAGAGKSFALGRLIEAVEARARLGAPGLISKAVVARVEAGSGDPAGAVAAAVYDALARDYPGLADEAADATADPRRAAAAAAERHDEIVGRLEQERRARDETQARRARLSDSLLHETPGSRIDAFIRAGRSAIETRLRRFGFDGDADANFRSLVGDLASQRARSRPGLFLRAIWAYRGQIRLILLAILAFALAFVLGWLRQPAAQSWLLSLSESLAPSLDWMKAHDDGLAYAGDALVAAGVAMLIVNVWRAASFTSLLFRGLRMLNLDLRERRRELDASAARLERRVATLEIEAAAAAERAEALARKAGGERPPGRPQGPDFVGPADAPERAARAFLDDVGRAMAASATPAPQRILIAIDGLEALPAPAARRFLETATRLAGRGFAVIACFDLLRLGEARESAERWFDVVCDVSADAAPSRWLEAGAAPAEPPAPRFAGLSGPLDEAEVGLLKAASALIGPRPRALKRFYNAYRLARLSDAPRGAVALSLAALMAPAPDAAAALRFALSGEGELTAPSGPAALRAAFEALRLEGMSKEAARRAFAAARRFAPWE
jgi:hypothetical protein